MKKVTRIFGAAFKKVLELTRKEPWLSRYTEHKEDILEQFAKYHDQTVEEFIGMLQKGDQYLSGQMAGVFIETFFEEVYDGQHDNVVSSYIKRFKYRMSKDEISILEQMRDNVFSIYEITDLKRGEYLILKDVFSKAKDIKVLEEKGSMDISILSHCIAKIIEIDEEKYFTGLIFPFSNTSVNLAKKSVRLVQKEEGVDTDEALRVLTIDFFTEAFYDHIKPRTVVNPNMEIMEFRNITFGIKNSDKVIETLDRLENIGIFRPKKDQLFWYLREERKNKKKLPSREDYIITADITIKKNNLMCLTTTEQSLKKILKELPEKLKSNIGLAKIEKATYEDTGSPEENLIDNKDRIAIITNYYDEYLKTCLIDKIPILNNMTARECLKKDPGRLKSWLKMLEENTQEQSEGAYNFSWVYKELGLA